MTVTIGRRELLAAFGGAAATWPLAARGQQAAIPIVGFLDGGSPETRRGQVASFSRGLNETGYIEGQNVTIEYRWAQDQLDRLPALATELVRRQVSVIAASSGIPAALAAKAATATIPIVFQIGVDPVKVGLVASLNGPGGNITGVANISSELNAKRLELLHELVPSASVIAVLVNPANPLNAETTPQDVQAAAQMLGLRTRVLRASTASDIDAAFVTLVEQGAKALFVANDAFFNGRGDQFAVLSARHRVPTMHELRESAVAGGLISYGASVPDVFRQVGVYAGKILKGEKPADLPVMQPTKFELVINRKTAKALGLQIPDKLLVLADEVIE
jgi:putative tryptophan/tyrosine transport system substrate-binding protein